MSAKPFNLPADQSLSEGPSMGDATALGAAGIAGKVSHHRTPGTVAAHPTDVLMDRARVRDAARTIAPGTDPDQVSPAQIAQVAADVEGYVRTHGLRRSDVARATGWEASVVSEFLRGTYAGNKGRVALDLEDWLTGEEARRAQQHPHTFTWTRVAREMQAVVMYCLDHAKVGLIYGPETSGLGKTTAILAIHQELGPRRSALITFSKSDANPSGVLRKLCQGLHIDDGGSNAVRMRRLVEHLTGRSHVLLIDQIHALRYGAEDKPFYYLMDLFDATRTAQLWCGTSDMVAYLQRQQAKTTDEPLAQIRRRLFPVVNLMEGVGEDGNPDGGGDPLFTVEDIRAMFARYRLQLTPAAARWLCAQARVPGGGALGMARNLMEYAVMLGMARRAPAVDVELLKQALRASLPSARAVAALQSIERLLATDRAQARVA